MKFNSINSLLPNASDLGSKINLHNAKNQLTRRLNTIRATQNTCRRQGNWHRSQLLDWDEQRVVHLLGIVDRRIAIRYNTTLQGKRHFSLHNLHRAITSRKENTFNQHTALLMALKRKYKVPNLPNSDVNQVVRMMSSNITARNQRMLNVILHWQVQAAKKRHGRS